MQIKDNRPVDVILIYPSMGIDFGAALAAPFSLLSIAAPLCKNGMNVKVIDQRIDKGWVAALKEALKDKPICCGISTKTGKQIFFGIQAAKIIRKETKGAIPIVWGGVHPTLLPEQTLHSEYVDIVCVGEGDDTFLNLVGAISNKSPLNEVKGIAFLDNGKFVFTGERPFVDVEKLLPTPWDLVNAESYINPDMYLKDSTRVLDVGQTSRGCPFRCTFCYSTAVHRHRWRAMSAEKALEMIIDSVRRFKLDGIWLRDDELCLDITRVVKICEGMIRAGLKVSWYTSGARITDILKASDGTLSLFRRSGAYVMRFGAESGSNRVLKFLKKGQTVEEILELNRRCKRFDIKPVYSLMCGMPTETFQEVDQTINLFYQLQRENPSATMAPLCQYTAFPGTALYDIAVQMGLRPPQRLEDWANWLNDEIDTSGERMPWFTKKQRLWLGNLTYLSNFSYAGSEVVSSVRNKPLGGLVNFSAGLLCRYFSWRLKMKLYRFIPELQLVIKASKMYVNLINKKTAINRNAKPERKT